MANIKTCDICGSKMNRFHCERYKLKRTVFNFMGESMCENLDICEKCMEGIIKTVRKERKTDGS